MKRKRQVKHPWPKSVLVLSGLVLVFLVLGTKLGFSKDREFVESLRIRADRLYEYDRKSKKLPPREVYALSVALNFGDYSGAEAAIRSLETRIR